MNILHCFKNWKEKRTLYQKQTFLSLRKIHTLHTFAKRNCKRHAMSNHIKDILLNPILHRLFLHPIHGEGGRGAYLSPLHNFLSRACRTKIFGSNVDLILNFFETINWNDDVNPRIDDVMF